MLRHVIFILFCLFQISWSVAEDYKTWALDQQEKSQQLIEKYEQEAFNLKNQSLSLKGCSVHKSLGCSKQQNLKPARIQQESSDSSLYIFVSFSMPKESLKALAVEAKKHNAVLVIRGLIDNSFVKTAMVLKELGEGIILDPTLFKEYDIRVLPTFVRNHGEGYSKIAGNVSLAYALEKLKEERE